MPDGEFEPFVIDWDYISDDEMVTLDSITEDTFKYKFPCCASDYLKKTEDARQDSVK